jgi:hypothetical protein
LLQKEHPAYFEAGGKVSVWGHSLGAVIMQGLLSHWADDLEEYLDQLKFEACFLYIKIARYLWREPHPGLCSCTATGLGKGTTMDKLVGVT